MVIINSTDPEEMQYSAVCKEEVLQAGFKSRHMSPPLQWYVWVIIGVSILAIVIIAANVLYWRFLRPKDPIDMIAQNFKLNEEEKKLFSNARDKLFIDETMVEVDYNVILGRGASSTVYKAVIKGIAPSLRPKKELESAVSEDYIVAAKVSNQFGREQIEELIGEIEAARTLENHPNICSMLGWSTHLGAPCLLFESMELDLLSYIKSLRVESIDTTSENDSLSQASVPISEHYSVPDFDENQQKIYLQILWQATKGLEYIASKNIVHRDVAARNFLLSRSGVTFTAKVADFGLCSNVDENTNVYRSTLNKRLPIKWLAIECLVDRTFSQASDVWAFGITMIEMYSCASELYPGIGLNEVTDFLKEGKRMEKPEKMPQEM
uniref:Protein kinase domain-containing protein n=1 Tax=Panagrolaimus davidi TaxID=227884 RepID=A0A914Q555_9BILA